MDSSCQSEVQSEVAAIVDMLCTTMAALFPSNWASSFASESVAILAKREMLATIIKWPLIPSVAGVRRVIEEVKDKGGDFPPSIATLVSKLKPRKADFGLPDDDVAWRETRINVGGPVESAHWSHPAVRAAAQRVNEWDIMASVSPYAERRTKESFLIEYQAECDAIMYGTDRNVKRLPVHSIGKRREVAARMRDNDSATRARQEVAQLEKETGIKADGARGYMLMINQLLKGSRNGKRAS